MLTQARQHALESRLPRHFLSIRLPTFEHPVLLHEPSAAVPLPPLQPALPPAHPSGRNRGAASFGQTPRQLAKIAAAGRAVATATDIPATSGRSTPRGGEASNAYAFEDGLMEASESDNSKPEWCTGANAGLAVGVGGSTAVSSAGNGGMASARADLSLGANAPLSLFDSASLFVLADGDLGRDSPSLARHHRLARSLLSAGFARELKPDSEERRRLTALVALPPTTRLREEEKELIWKFRWARWP